MIIVDNLYHKKVASVAAIRNMLWSQDPSSRQGLAALDMALCIALYCGSAWSVRMKNV